MQNRRDFLKFLGRNALAVQLLSQSDWLAEVLQAATPFSGISPSGKDELLLAKGLHSRVLLRFNQLLNTSGMRFGANTDYTHFFPEGSQAGYLWVNHEFPRHLDLYTPGKFRTKSNVDKEKKSVGGSLVALRRMGGHWIFVPNHPRNFRIDATTRIPFAWKQPIANARYAVGTMENCSGGYTPWGTILTCEENTHFAYGEIDRKGNRNFHEDAYHWEKAVDYHPWHYGWVVEVNPLTRAAKKLVALGRFGHEGATVGALPDGRCVVYSGDDREGECIYKFISDKPHSLETGTLYVADTQKGRWLPLNWAENEKLKNEFKDQTEILVHTREAAKLVGGSPQDRPEDIEIDPLTRSVYVALTKGKKSGNLFGSLLKIEEKGGKLDALEFSTSTFLAGGSTTGFANPDNLAFDPAGNLWVTTDISGSKIGKGVYAPFKNNGLFVIPLKGASAGKAIQVASAPIEAEFTGPSFTPDGQTLFLSVQHPGSNSKSKTHLSSHWPDGGNKLPRSAVVTITGPALKNLV